MSEKFYINLGLFRVFHFLFDLYGFSVQELSFPSKHCDFKLDRYHPIPVYTRVGLYTDNFRAVSWNADLKTATVTAFNILEMNVVSCTYDLQVFAQLCQQNELLKWEDWVWQVCSHGSGFMNVSLSGSISGGVGLKGEADLKYAMYLFKKKSTFIKQFKHFLSRNLETFQKSFKSPF